MGWKVPAMWAVLAVAGLAVAGASVGLVVHGPGGALAGVVPGALAGVVAGFVPAFRDHAESERAQTAAAQRAWSAVAEPAPDWRLSPVGLLRPDRAVVEFTGRETELGILRAWCAAGTARSVRVLVGAGGTGKTRLALQVAAEWEASGKLWRLVAAGAEGNAVQAARGVTSDRVLLLVDYAETRGDLGELLRAVLADRGPVRVLLVARSLGEWWDRLVEHSAYAVARLLDEAAPVRLDAPVSKAEHDAGLAEAAVPYFARLLGVPAPERVVFELRAGRAPILVLHAAALVAVLRSADDRAPMQVAVGGVLDELLEHEARYWRRTATAARRPNDGHVLKPVVAAAALLGASGLDDAASVAGRVPELAGTSAGELRGWARWLYGLYPAGAHGRLGSLQPDLLAEAHVTNQLTEDPDLARACLTGLAEGQAERALTVLARAWAHHPAAQQVIAAALRDDLAHLAVPAAAVAVQTRTGLGGVLEAALRDAPASLDTLTQIAEALPRPSLVLGPASLAVTARIRASLPPESEPQTVARWADQAGIVLSALGRPADALPATQEAVATYRELAKTSPDRFCPDLARSLNNLGKRFWELGRPRDALPVDEEAVAIYRELVEASPDRYRADLAQSLHGLSVTFWELGRPADALPVEEEAVAIRRELAEASPDRYRPDLAQSLNGLGITLWALGRLHDALPVEEEAVAIYRELVEASPDRYRPNFAQSLYNLGFTFSGLGRPGDALPVTREALAIRRELAEASPDRYRPDLAQSLDGLGVTFSELGRPAHALPVIREAVAIRRELAEASPDRYRPDLAQSLTNLAGVLSSLGKHPEAKSAHAEAFSLRSSH